ncbi:MAG TPA: thioredoxin family protein [Tepidisphaeraceae bacterium]|nr:thioredoxin family protein [Tepidisphaeraceae bacterium]
MFKSLITVATVLAFASLALADMLPIGKPAPQFTLQDATGQTISLKDYAGKIVVLEWTNPQCPFVRRHYREKTMTTLAGKYKSDDVVWLAIDSSSFVTDADLKSWAGQEQIPYPILNDAKGTVGHAYDATNTPEMFIIGKDGNLLYEGAIDNDRDNDKGADRVNYVKQALSQILAGKSVTVTQTKPYGCTVKYAD